MGLKALSRRLIYVAMGAAVTVLPTVALGGSHESAPRVLAACNDVVDTTDSFSMDCVPTVIPDTSDQLTEAEVAMPGWNAGGGGSQDASHSGGGHGGHG
jgi:hypothetical protein